MSLNDKIKQAIEEDAQEAALKLQGTFKQALRDFKAGIEDKHPFHQEQMEDYFRQQLLSKVRGS